MMIILIIILTLLLSCSVIEKHGDHHHDEDQFRYRQFLYPYRHPSGEVKKNLYNYFEYPADPAIKKLGRIYAPDVVRYWYISPYVADGYNTMVKVRPR